MHLKSLTSLRFFAAALVVVSHLPLVSAASNPWIEALYRSVFREGYIGVTFFFVLSGFILSFSYVDKLRDGRTDYVDFMIVRIARIYPLHVLTLLMAFPLAIAMVGNTWAGWDFFTQLALHLTLTQAFSPADFAFNGPSWSLSVEMFFYLTFPLLVTFRTAALAILVAGIATMHLLAPSGLESAHFLLYVFPPARLADFAVGILMYRVYVRHSPSDTAATALQCGAVMLLSAFFALQLSIPQALRYDVYYLLPMALLVLSFAWQNGTLAKAISGRSLVFLGEASFALYLVHQLVIRYGDHVRVKVFHATGAGGEALFAIFYVIISIALSAILFVRFEVPMKIATAQLLRRLRKPGAREARGAS